MAYRYDYKSGQGEHALDQDRETGQSGAVDDPLECGFPDRARKITRPDDQELFNRIDQYRCPDNYDE
jgi:hypothetical protein